MEQRERTLASIKHRQPDRPTIYVSLTPQVAQRLCEKFGYPYEEPFDAMESARISHMDLLTSMGVDIVAVAPAHNIQPDTPVENIMAFFDAALNP